MVVGLRGCCREVEPSKCVPGEPMTRRALCVCCRRRLHLSNNLLPPLATGEKTRCHRRVGLSQPSALCSSSPGDQKTEGKACSWAGPWEIGRAEPRTRTHELFLRRHREWLEAFRAAHRIVCVQAQMGPDRRARRRRKKKLHLVSGPGRHPQPHTNS